ncbi:MAG: putative transposase, partial [candidate division NC10 bacterium]
MSFDTNPADRRVDRLLAYLGLLDDAAPLFRSCTRVPHGGVLLALPALAASGVFTIARKIYGSIGPAVYGLRTTLVALLLMALLRIKRPEGLKEHSPDDLGRVLGLDRAPEVKTLRRKLSRLAAFGRAAEFGRALAQRRVADRGAAMGFLYIDGHVRVYHGQRTLPKAHVARMRLAMPATTDYWVNDAVGDPLFVVTAEANAGMVKMLPGVLEEVRALVGQRRVTVVFDRGGYNPTLFLQFLADGFDLLTYRKGRSRRVARSRFTLHEAVIDSRKVSYTLADQGVRLLGGKLRLRQVTRLAQDGHQTPILTSRRDLPAVEIAFRMFERWRQENF